ncbi:MAG: hypothetical protein WCJ14_05625 [Verrucomicrobiota bacterium]
MKKSLEILALLLFSLGNGCGAICYDGVGFSAFLQDPKLDKFLLVDERTGQKSDCVRFGARNLTQQWKRFSLVLSAEGDGLINLRFGPMGASEIPIYLDEIQVNGVPLPNGGFEAEAPDGTAPGWTLFYGKVVTDPGLAFAGKSCMRLADSRSGFWQGIGIKRGEKMEVSLMARTGSALECFADELGKAQQNLELSVKVAARSRGLSASRMPPNSEFARCVNDLIHLSESQLHVSVPLLALNSITPEALRDKLLDLAKAWDAERRRTAGEERPCLYDKPEVFVEIKNRIRELARFADELKTDVLLELMFVKQKKSP